MNPETALVERARGGDEEAFMELVTIYKPKITKMASRFGRDVAEVSDLTQEIFLEVWKSIPKFRAEAPFEHWLSRVALNRCRKFLRSEYSRRKHEVLQGEPVERRASGDERNEKDTKELLDRAMRQLKPDDALVLTLKELDGYSLEEVAKLTGWTVANVKVRSHRARKRLKEILEQTGEWP
ncbi:MAG: sigma-70 family RNA polymerase sigma factor [Verrucomicrobiales bacterium]|nr:sigma-70 family RNA polymerase sigma factor [Verrucomicrobiales bacterium]